MSKKLIININTPSQSDDRKTGVFPSRRPWKPGRRRLQRGIQFIDLGYRLSGEEYVEIPFTDPNLPDPVTFDADSLVPFQPLPVTSAHYDAVISEVFTVPIAEWKQNYRIIDNDYTDNIGMNTGQLVVTYKGNVYELSGETDDVWSEGTFTPDEPPVSETFNVVAPVRSLWHGIGNSANYKWTTENDYAASAVTFTPSPSMDVYMMPSLNLNTFSSLLDGIPQLLEVMCYHRVIWPRETQIDPTSEYYSLNRVDSTFYAGSWTAVDEGQPPEVVIGQYTVAYRAVTMFKDKFPYFADRAEYDLMSETHTRVGMDLEDFMLSSDYPEPPTLPSGRANGLSWSLSAGTPPNGTLLGVVKKGGVFYYCWQDI